MNTNKSNMTFSNVRIFIRFIRIEIQIIFQCNETLSFHCLVPGNMGKQQISHSIGTCCNFFDSFLHQKLKIQFVTVMEFGWLSGT